MVNANPRWNSPFLSFKQNSPKFQPIKTRILMRAKLHNQNIIEMVNKFEFNLTFTIIQYQKIGLNPEFITYLITLLHLSSAKIKRNIIYNSFDISIKVLDNSFT